MRGRIEDTPDHCAIETAMEVLGGRWKLAILQQLSARTRRFGELKRVLPGITQRMLTKQLRELEADGLVMRMVYREVPPRVEYSLSEVGRSLEKITDLLDEWGRWYRDLARDDIARAAGERGPGETVSAAARPASGPGTG